MHVALTSWKRARVALTVLGGHGWLSRRRKDKRLEPHGRLPRRVRCRPHFRYLRWGIDSERVRAMRSLPMRRVMLTVRPDRSNPRNRPMHWTVQRTRFPYTRCSPDHMVLQQCLGARLGMCTGRAKGIRGDRRAACGTAADAKGALARAPKSNGAGRNPHVEDHGRQSDDTE
jgi:hypothetical protein